MRIHELMTATAHQSLTSGQTVEHAARRMTMHGLSFLPVCRPGGAVIGVITERDIVTKAVAQARAPELCVVDEVMTRAFPSCLAEEEATDVHGRMMAEGIERMVVRDSGGRLAGVVDRARLSGAVNQHRQPSRRLRRSA